MKIVHLTSAHPVGDTRILHKEAATLAGAGHEVVLVAAGDDDWTVIQSVRIRMVARARGGRLGRMTGTVWQVLQAARSERADVCHFHDPELIPAGVWLKILGRRVVYDVHDDLPAQILSKHWIHPALRRPIAFAARLLEGATARLFDAVVVANPAHARRFPDGTVAVRNLPDLAEFSAPRRAPAGAPALAYVGDLTRARGAEKMVQAMALLPEASPARLLLAGRFSEPGLEAACRAHPGWARVDFHGWLDRPAVAALLAEARAGLVLLHPVAHYRSNYPIKLFEYMAAGIPVIAADLPLCREVVDRTGCGLVVNPLDPAAIAAAILRLLEHPQEAEAMGRRGRAAVEETDNWQREASTLINLYERLRPEPLANSVAGLRTRP